MVPSRSVHRILQWRDLYIALKPYRLANYTSSVSPTKNMVALSLTLSRNSALLDIWLPSTNAP